jgi:hypothetical protein
MNTNELEELIYEYGHVMYRLGRMETDDKASTKDYNKTLSQKEKIVEEFKKHFKTSSKVAKTLGIVC